MTVNGISQTTYTSGAQGVRNGGGSKQCSGSCPCGEACSSPKGAKNVSMDSAQFSQFAQMLSQKEGLSIDSEQTFSQYDTNSDGTLTQTELQQFMTDNGIEPHRKGPVGERPDVSSDMFTDLISRLNEDNGTELSADELFTKYDADSNGTLSKAEMQQFMSDNNIQPHEKPEETGVGVNGRRQHAGIAAYLKQENYSAQLVSGNAFASLLQTYSSSFSSGSSQTLLDILQ